MPRLHRSGVTLYLLIGRYGMRIPSIEAYTSSIPITWTDPPKRRGAKQATIATQPMLPIRAVSGARPQSMDSESKPSHTPRATSEIHVGSPQEMEQIGAFFGQDSRSGDVVLLWGRDLGTGKTCFARGFIRARIGNPHLAVTSPTYLLDNTYQTEDEDLTVHHMDLYRFHHGRDLHVVDIPRVLEKEVCLIEWPDRLGAAKPSNRLDIHLVAINESERIVTLTGHGAWWAGAVDDFKDYQG